MVIFGGKNLHYNEKSQKWKIALYTMFADMLMTIKQADFHDVWKDKLTFSFIIYIYFSFFLQLDWAVIMFDECAICFKMFFFDNKVFVVY